METKVCKTCGVEKPLFEFARSTVGAKGVIAHCKECFNWAHRSEESKRLYSEKKDFKERGVKRCSNCKQVKPIKDFPKSKGRTDGIHCYCSICLRVLSLEVSRKPSTIQKKKEREATREFLDNLAKYRKNSVRYKETVKRYRATSPVFKNYQDEYRRRLYVKVRRDLSTRVWAELKLYGKTKQSSYDEYLGCTIEFFFNYLEERFVDGMSWDNWGRGSDKWHIDHIVSCAEFDMNDEEQVKKCFHYTNQRPLWEPENLRKNSKNAEGKRIFKRYKNK